MEAIYRGENVCLRFPTGYGKTSCFDVPFMIRKAIVIIVVPLVALLLDMFTKVRGIISSIDRREADLTDFYIANVDRIIDQGKSVFFLHNV